MIEIHEIMQYDNLNRLTLVNNMDVITAHYEYTPNGNVKTETKPNLTTTYKYSVGGMLTGKQTNSKTDGLIQNNSYTYNLNGNMITKVDSGGTTNYAYDGHNRLTSEEINGKIESVVQTMDYIYDQKDSSVSNLSYGNDTIGNNGCELIAVYNALIKLGEPKTLETVISDAENSNGILWAGGKFGSHPDKLGLLLEKYNRPYVSSKDKSNFNNMLYDGGTYIVLYYNKGKVTIYTVMFTCDSKHNIYVYNEKSNKNVAVYASLDDFLNRQGDSIILYGVK